MKKSLTLLCLALPLPAFAQDRIVWTDGVVTDPRTRVDEFTAFHIRYTVRGGRQEESSDRVQSIDVERVREAYRRGWADSPEQVLTTARRLLGDGDKFLAQFGLQRAGKLFLDQGRQEDGFNTLDELKEKVPESGFLPDCFRLKIQYLLSQGKPGAGLAATLADQYARQVVTSGMPAGFGLEAEYYQAVAGFTDGSVDATGLQRTLATLLVKVSSTNPTLANKVRLAIGEAVRAQGKADEARSLFEELAQSDAVDVDTRAGAYLGLGHLAYEHPTPDRENYRQALLAFLRVYVETREADDEVVAEALHFASEAANNWKGQDSQYMSVKLQRILTSEYGHTSWGKPK